MVERLQQLGQWLKVNGESIYNSKPWEYQNDTLTDGVWYTSSEDDSAVYAIVLNWPKKENKGKLSLGHVKADVEETTIEMLGYKEKLSFELGEEEETIITFPTLDPYDLSTLSWAWVLKITGEFSTNA